MVQKSCDAKHSAKGHKIYALKYWTNSVWHHCYLQSRKAKFPEAAVVARGQGVGKMSCWFKEEKFIQNYSINNVNDPDI